MKISTKGRYALRIMLDIAEHEGAGAVSAGEAAQRQEISVKYAEAIIASLQRANLVCSRRGKAGGYVLSRAPQEISVAQILTAGEGSLAAVACLSSPQNECPRAARCKTLPFWQALQEKIKEFCCEVTLNDLLQGNIKK